MCFLNESFTVSGQTGMSKECKSRSGSILFATRRASRDSKIDLFNMSDKRGKRIRCPNPPGKFGKNRQRNRKGDRQTVRIRKTI